MRQTATLILIQRTKQIHQSQIHKPHALHQNHHRVLVHELFICRVATAHLIHYDPVANADLPLLVADALENAEEGHVDALGLKGEGMTKIRFDFVFGAVEMRHSCLWRIIDLVVIHH